MEFFSCPETGTYLCYAYGRLSKKDAEKARRENDESNSIKNQREIGRASCRERVSPYV